MSGYFSNIPLESTKYSRCLTSSAIPPTRSASPIVQQNRKSDEARKPEYHSNEFDAKGCIVVGGSRKADRCRDEVDEYQEGPNAAEEKEVGLGGRPMRPAIHN